MSNIMNQLLNSSPMTGNVEIDVDLEHTEGINNPEVQVVSFINDLKEKVSGIFIPDQGKSISHLTRQKKASLELNTFGDKIQEATLDGINGIFSFDKLHTYSMQAGDELTVNITGKEIRAKNMNTEFNVMIPNKDETEKKLVSGLFVAKGSFSTDPFQSIYSVRLTIVKKNDGSDTYIGHINGRNPQGGDMKIHGTIKITSVEKMKSTNNL